MLRGLARTTRRLTRLYLILCGLALNFALASLVLFSPGSVRPLLATALGKLATQIEHVSPVLGKQFRDLDSHAAALRGTGGEVGIKSERPRRPELPDRSFKPVKPIFEPKPPLPNARRLMVGPGLEFATPSQAARAAQNGDIIEIEPGDYPGDTAIWRQSNLTIRGRGDMVWLDAMDTPLPQEKAIWIVSGDNITIENIAFFGARSRDLNGAGIRAEGTNLIIRNCYFFANETGILTIGSKPDSELLIEHSEFAWNGHASGQAHGIYIGRLKRLLFRFNYVHHTLIGNHVKSRAAETHLLYNRIMDEKDGYGNYIVDIPNGGSAIIVGNMLSQGRLGENAHMVAFGAEGVKYETSALFLINNTMVNERNRGWFVRNWSDYPAYAYNNLMVGAGEPLTGEFIAASNMSTRPYRSGVGRLIESLKGEDPGKVSDPGLKNFYLYDYSLRADSPAIDAGADLNEDGAALLRPKYEYVHPRNGRLRPKQGRIDIGAFEFIP